VKKDSAARIGLLIASECISVRVRRLGRLITRIYDAALAPHGVNTAQMNLLAAIAVTGGARAADLTHILEAEKSTLSRDLKRMEQLGWVRTAASPRSRGRIVILTPAGSRLLVELEETWNKAQAAVEKQLGPRDFARLRAALPSPLKS